MQLPCSDLATVPLDGDNSSSLLQALVLLIWHDHTVVVAFRLPVSFRVFLDECCMSFCVSLVNTPTDTSGRRTCCSVWLGMDKCHGSAGFPLTSLAQV